MILQIRKYLLFIFSSESVYQIVFSNLQQDQKNRMLFVGTSIILYSISIIYIFYKLLSGHFFRKGSVMAKLILMSLSVIKDKIIRHSFIFTICTLFHLDILKMYLNIILFILQNWSLYRQSKLETSIIKRNAVQLLIYIPPPALCEDFL